MKNKIKGGGSGEPLPILACFPWVSCIGCSHRWCCHLHCQWRKVVVVAGSSLVWLPSSIGGVGGGDGGGGGDLSSLRPSHPHPLFNHPLSAASTHDPPCEQWLTELGVGAGCWSLASGLLVHRYSGGCPLSCCPVAVHHCAVVVHCCPIIHPASNSLQQWHRCAVLVLACCYSRVRT